jgi:hypothetical protein
VTCNCVHAYQMIFVAKVKTKSSQSTDGVIGQRVHLFIQATMRDSLAQHAPVPAFFSNSRGDIDTKEISELFWNHMNLFPNIRPLFMRLYFHPNGHMLLEDTVVHIIACPSNLSFHNHANISLLLT